MKQPSPPRMTMVPWIWVKGLEILLLVTTIIMKPTTYMVGMGSPSGVREGGGMTGVIPPGLTGVMASPGIFTEIQAAMTIGSFPQTAHGV